MVTQHQIYLFPVSRYKLGLVQVNVDLLDQRFGSTPIRPIVQLIPIRLQMLHLLLYEQLMNNLVQHL